MSKELIRIYVCPKFKSIEDMHTKIMSVRRTINETLQTEFQEILADSWCGYHDRCEAGLIKKPSKEYQDFLDQAIDCYTEYPYKQANYHACNFYYTVRVFPYGGEIYLKIFGRVGYGLDRQFIKIGCKEFLPAGLTDKEEHLRKKMWYGLFDDRGWQECGFEYDFSLNPLELPYMLCFNEIKQYFHPFNDRAESMAILTILRRFTKTTCLPHDPEGYVKGKEYLYSLKGKTEWKKNRKKMSLKLSKTVQEKVGTKKGKCIQCLKWIPPKIKKVGKKKVSIGGHYKRAKI